jgi:hypothetical protein
VQTAIIRGAIMAETKNTGAGIHKTKLDYNDPMLLLEVEGLARDGYDDCQIAELLDVAAETFCRNKKKKQKDGSISQLSQALTRGRRPLNVLVENSLYKRAIGQTVKTKTTVRKWVVIPGLNNDMPVEVVSETETETEIPGSDLAQQFWLKNRKPDVYNIQPERVDLTSNGKEVGAEPPRITKIEHVTVANSDVKKQDVEV